MTMQRDYILSGATDEQRRLHAQAAILDPLTARLFDAAGLAGGSRVLDLGSGAGHTAMLASEFVGPEGEVVSVDNDRSAVAMTRSWAEPEVVVRAAIAHTRVGGLLCFHEPDFNSAWAQPETPLWQQIRTWIRDVLAAGGVEDRMGMALVSLYRAVGLPDPELRIEAAGGIGDGAVGGCHCRRDRHR